MTRIAITLALLAIAVLSACGDDERSDPGQIDTDRRPIAVAASEDGRRAPADDDHDPTPDRRPANPGRPDPSTSDAPAARHAKGVQRTAEPDGRRKRATRRPRSERPQALPLTADGRRDLRAARRVVRDLVRGLNGRDATLCRRLYTQSGLEEATGRRGAAAGRRCRTDVRRGGPEVRLTRIEGARVAGDVAIVQFSSSVGALAKRQALRLVRSGSRFRIDGAARAEDLR